MLCQRHPAAGARWARSWLSSSSQPSLPGWTRAAGHFWGEGLQGCLPQKHRTVALAGGGGPAAAAPKWRTMRWRQLAAPRQAARRLLALPTPAAPTFGAILALFSPSGSVKSCGDGRAGELSRELHDFTIPPAQHLPNVRIGIQARSLGQPDARKALPSSKARCPAAAMLQRPEPTAHLDGSLVNSLQGPDEMRKTLKYHVQGRRIEPIGHHLSTAAAAQRRQRSGG